MKTKLSIFLFLVLILPLTHIGQVAHARDFAFFFQFEYDLWNHIYSSPHFYLDPKTNHVSAFKCRRHELNYLRKKNSEIWYDDKTLECKSKKTKIKGTQVLEQKLKEMLDNDVQVIFEFDYNFPLEKHFSRWGIGPNDRVIAIFVGGDYFIHETKDSEKIKDYLLQKQKEGVLVVPDPKFHAMTANKTYHRTFQEFMIPGTFTFDRHNHQSVKWDTINSSWNYAVKLPFNSSSWGVDFIAGDNLENYLISNDQKAYVQKKIDHFDEYPQYRLFYLKGKLVSAMTELLFVRKDRNIIHTMVKLISGNNMVHYPLEEVPESVKTLGKRVMRKIKSNHTTPFLTRIDIGCCLNDDEIHTILKNRNAGNYNIVSATGEFLKKGTTTAFSLQDMLEPDVSHARYFLNEIEPYASGHGSQNSTHVMGRRFSLKLLEKAFAEILARKKSDGLTMRQSRIN